MNIKRINKVLIYTLLVFSLFTFSVYPKSHAKYFKEDESLFYGITLNNMFKGVNDQISYLSGTNYKNAKFTFKFDRSTMLKNNESLKYKIVVYNNCTIDKVVTKGSKSVNNNIATITYNDNNDDQIQIQYSCNIDESIVQDSGIDFVYTNYKVYETYQPDNIEYLYMRGSYKISLDNYYQLYPLPSGVISDDKKVLILPKDSNNKYKTFTSWISDYANQYGADYLNILQNYIQTKYLDEVTILNTTLSLPGITVEFDSTTNEYKYTLDDNVIGYARTKYANYKNNMYFTDDNLTSEKLNEIFIYYLENFVFPDDDIIKNKVVEYINNKGGIYKLYKGEIKIPGVVYYPESDLITISQNIMDIITASESSPVFATHGNKFDMFDSVVAGLTSNYSFITDAVIDYLNNNCYDFVNMWMKTAEVFDEYFVIIPEIEGVRQNPILFHIYSPYVESDPTTHVNYVTATELISGMEVKVEYNISDIQGLKTTLTNINNATGKTLTFADRMFTTSGTYNDGYYTSVVTGSTITISFIIE